MEIAQILIVEDENIVALDLKHRLKNSGYGVVDIVKTGEAAVELVKTLTPNLILMDIHLKGGLDGIQTAEIIRKDFNLPVIFLTAFADENTLKRAREVGAFGYILKPFEEQSLVTNIEMALYKHKMERVLRESEEHYRSLVETMPDAVFLTDLDFHIQFCNQQAVQMYQFESQQDLIGKNALDLLAPEHHSSMIRDVQEIVKNGESKMMEYSLLCNHGISFPGEIKASVLRDTSGKPRGFIAISRDISERKRLEKKSQDLFEQIQNLSRRDALTNLYNRRYFFEVAEVEFSRTIRHQHALAMIMVDLDHFKRINDTYGHLVGDQVLRIVSEQMQSNLRAFDILGRIGGEEFLILLPETNLDDAQVIAGRLCKDISQNPASISNEKIFVTASFGISVLTDDCSSLEVLTQRADQALYTAKLNGRNQVMIWNKSSAATRELPSHATNAGNTP